jgi:hypothetical protein
MTTPAAQRSGHILLAAVASTAIHAGVKIVQNDRPLWGSHPTWRLSAKPIVVIDHRDGKEAFTSFQHSITAEMRSGSAPEPWKDHKDSEPAPRVVVRSQ